MVFSSVLFIFLFLPITLAIYYLIPKRFRNTWLLVCSLMFYFWGDGQYVYVMLFYIVFNYFAARIIEYYRGQRLASRISLAAALIINLGILVYFKYIAFIITNLNRIGEVLYTTVKVPGIHLPLGISFIAFQAISYLIDVYRQDVDSEKNFIDFSMYKAFFPKLIAGPIIRYRDIASQMVTRNNSLEAIITGFQRFTIGLGKKVLIANHVGPIADNMFRTSQQDLSTPQAWLGMVCYALQIYFDFSGYSDMAIGLAKMFGFDFKENFNYPYISTSIKEFWRRWHISLSSWFRDYLYISMGGNHSGRYRTFANLFTVFLLCGLWHGASWTFVIWGAWHGLFLVLERTSFGKIISKLPRAAGTIYTWLIVLLGWVFFRADSMNQAYYIFKALLFMQPANSVLTSTPDLSAVFAMVIGVIAMTPIAPKMKSLLENHENNIIHFFSKIFEYSWILVIFIASAAFLANSTYSPFIYFKF